MAEKLVTLTVPAEPVYARLVRMLAADVATVADLTIDIVEDIRMAAEEGFIYAQAVSEEPVQVTYTQKEGDFVIHLRFVVSKVAEDELDEQQMTYLRLILEAVSDNFEIDAANGSIIIHVASEGE